MSTYYQPTQLNIQAPIKPDLRAWNHCFYQQMDLTVGVFDNFLALNY